MTSFAFNPHPFPRSRWARERARVKPWHGGRVRMLAATLVGAFFGPVFYVLLQRVSERQWPFRRADAAPPSGAVEEATRPSPAPGD
jgi:hypothetical protein